MWIFGAIITFGLLSFNLAQVRVEGNPTLPYLLAAIGYPGLLLVTLLFVWRFLASMEARTQTAATLAQTIMAGGETIGATPAAQHAVGAPQPAAS